MHFQIIYLFKQRFYMKIILKTRIISIFLCEHKIMKVLTFLEDLKNISFLKFKSKYLFLILLLDMFILNSLNLWRRYWESDICWSWIIIYWSETNINNRIWLIFINDFTFIFVKLIIWFPHWMIRETYHSWKYLIE